MAEQDNSIFKLFGFELKRAEDKQKEEKKKNCLLYTSDAADDA